MTVVAVNAGRILKNARPVLGDLRALNFNNAALSYAVTQNITPLGGEMSMECFYKPTTVGALQFLGGFGTSGSADRFYFQLQATGKMLVSWRGSDVGLNYTITSLASFTAGVIYHICATYSATDSRLRFYINGVEDTNVAATGSLATRVLQIGGSAGGSLNAVLDNLRVYRRKLTPAEVADHYIGIFADNTNLIGEYKMNAGIGTGISDTSGQNNHAVSLDIQNVTWVDRLVDF